MTKRPQLRAALLLAGRLAGAALVLVLAAIPVALVLLRLLQRGRLGVLDARAASKLAELAYRSPRTAQLAGVVTDLGQWMTLVAIAVVVAALLVAVRRRREALFLITTTVAGIAVCAALKAVVVRARSAFIEPIASALDKSFPSGHAMNSALVYGAVLLVVLPLLRPALRVIAVVCAVAVVAAIAASRVAIGFHYISDVVAGMAFGVAWLIAAAWAFAIWRKDMLPAVDL